MELSPGPAFSVCYCGSPGQELAQGFLAVAVTPSQVSHLHTHGLQELPVLWFTVSCLSGHGQVGSTQRLVNLKM